MEIKSQQLKHCSLISVNGKVDSYTAPELAKAIEGENRNGIYKIVIDFSHLTYMSSAGFRTLLVGQRNCKRYNRGEIVMAAVPKTIMDALDLTGFTPLFKIFNDVTSAVGSF
jgi:anti-sigma B factor antagonist